MLELRALGRPVVQAPMAGGASTPALAAAVSEAGGLGFLAAGYKTAAAVRADITATRALTSRPFGVNVFMPAAGAVDEAAVAAYRERLVPEGERLGAEPGDPSAADRTDAYDDKIADLLADPPAAVSFTFGCPDAATVRALRERGALVIVTVTTAREAVTAATSGAGALCVQGAEAGAHQGSFTDTGGLDDPIPLRRLLAAVRSVTTLPLIAAGGLGTGAQIAEVLGLGAVAAQLGTAFLRCPESGASAVHKAALTDPRFTRTALTRAFSGRPARGLVNRFMEEHGEHAPAAYPDVHYITAPLRRAASARGDAEAVNLWAGTAYRLAREAPAAEIVAALTADARRP
ncbi:nitronate monooxygenase [Actinomadura rugatobispora]|uniref:Propionate 3-nitronate monooxygenase n=1 Tax=Actinomadura rugatobispora TaxID=1994 RepID=A0ABW1A283_9ACTN|nr:nitronate monooxygenase [Actinomadura rugatobispora]